MGFMTMPLTNPFIYSWIVEKIINEGKNPSMRVKKVGSIRPLNRVAKTQSENCSRERPLRKNTQNVVNLKGSVTPNFKRRGRRVKKSAPDKLWWIMKNY